MRLVFAKIIADIIDRTGDDILEPLLEFASERKIVEHHDPLFDSGRTYADQIARYKLFQGKDEAFAARYRAKRALATKTFRAKKKAKADADRVTSMPKTRADAAE